MPAWRALSVFELQRRWVWRRCWTALAFEALLACGGPAAPATSATDTVAAQDGADTADALQAPDADATAQDAAATDAALVDTSGQSDAAAITDALTDGLVADQAAGSDVAATDATAFDAAGDCPAPLVCTATGTVAGSVCLPPEGVQACQCSAWAVSVAASTHCTAAVGKQLCPGTRACTSVGAPAGCTPDPQQPCIDAVRQGSKNGSLCDDGDACTADTTCQQGLCTGGKNIGECKTNADCLAQDDGNLCNVSLLNHAATATEVASLALGQCLSK